MPRTARVQRKTTETEIERVLCKESVDVSCHHSVDTWEEVGFGRSVEDPAVPGMLEKYTRVFEDAVRDFIAAGGKGINVTVPFKVRAEAMADEAERALRRVDAEQALGDWSEASGGDSLICPLASGSYYKLTAQNRLARCWQLRRFPLMWARGGRLRPDS